MVLSLKDTDTSLGTTLTTRFCLELAPPGTEFSPAAVEKSSGACAVRIFDVPTRSVLCGSYTGASWLWALHGTARLSRNMLCQLDMGKSQNVIIHAAYWCAEIEEENIWQIKISL